MDRRRFLRAALAGAASAALGGVALRSFPALAGDPARFAEGLREHPWLAGWQSVRSETLGPATVPVLGDQLLRPSNGSLAAMNRRRGIKIAAGARTDRDIA